MGVSMIATLIAQFWPYIAGAVAIALAYFGVKAKGASDERTKIDAQVNKQADAARKEAKNVDDKVDSMGDAAIRDTARQWVRQPGKDSD
jgi:hypothetical protein